MGGFVRLARENRVSMEKHVYVSVEFTRRTYDIRLVIPDQMINYCI